MKTQLPFFLVILFSFLYSSGSYAKVYPEMNCKKWKPLWSECKNDSDCAVVSNPCGWPTSASNKYFSNEAAKCNQIEGAAISCPSWNELEGGKRNSICLSKKCANREKSKVDI